MGQRAHYGGVSQHHRVWRRHLRMRGGGAALFRPFSKQTDTARGGTTGRYTAIAAEAQSQARNAILQASDICGGGTNGQIWENRPQNQAEKTWQRGRRDPVGLPSLGKKTEEQIIIEERKRHIITPSMPNNFLRDYQMK